MKSKYYQQLRGQFPINFLDDRKLSLLLENTFSEDEVRTIFGYMYQLQKSSPMLKENGELLFSLIDKTQYSVRDWVVAIMAFDNWLGEKGRKSDFKKMIGYIECSTLSPENKVLKYELKDLLLKMLNEFGYVG